MRGVIPAAYPAGIDRRNPPRNFQYTNALNKGTKIRNHKNRVFQGQSRARLISADYLPLLTSFCRLHWPSQGCTALCVSFTCTLLPMDLNGNVLMGHVLSYVAWALFCEKGFKRTLGLEGPFHSKTEVGG